MSNTFDRFIIQAPNDPVSHLIQSLSFQINGFGYYLQQDSGFVPAFSVNDHEWIFYTQGRTSISCEAAAYTLGPGDYLLLEPDKVYSAKCLSEEPVHYFYIHFSLSPENLINAYIKSIFGDSAQRSVSGSIMPNLHLPFSSLLDDRLHGEVGTTILIRELLIRMSIYMIRYQVNAHPSTNASHLSAFSGSNDVLLCNQAIKLMHAHLGENLKIETICSQMGVSTSFLYKLFIRVFHLSPAQYLMQERLKSVCTLLLTTHHSVAEISDMLGFSSPSHLISQFRKKYGCTPRQWLKDQHSQSNPL